MRPARWRGPGRLIVFEGCDGSGKSTQARLLLRWLLGRGLPAVLTMWNSSSVIAPAIRRGKRRRRLVPPTYSLVHACDLAERVERSVLPHLEAGFVVVADRWTFTAQARDVSRGCDQRWVRELYEFAPQPDLAFYCAVPAEESLRRILAARERPGYYEAGLDVAGAPGDRVSAFLDFQRRMAARYDEMVETCGLVRVDAVRPVAEQQRHIRRQTADLLADRRLSVGPATEAAAAEDHRGGRPC